MDVLIKLGQALTRDGLKTPGLRQERVLINMFESANPIGETVSKPKEPSILPRNQFVKNNITLVGKGSHFQKKVVKEYLSPLRAHPFSRHEIKDNYEIDKARRINHRARMLETSKKSQELLINNSREFIGDMLAALISCTPKNVKMTSENLTRIYPKYTMDQLPKVPNFDNNSRLFEDYIGIMTHTSFLYKSSSRLNGIIPKIIRNLLHPGNIKTTHLRTTQCYNDMIYFFCERFDFASCREIFVQMKIENVSPNTTTYNLMLHSILKNSHIRKTKLPDNEVLYYLRRMRAGDLTADTVTWTTCYNFLKEDISRLIFIEQMQQRNVPITPRFIYTVLRNGPYSSKECLEFLSSNKVPLDQKLFSLCIENLLEENQLDIAWIFLEHTLKKHTRDFTIGHKILNSFLRVFADKGRLDLALATFNTCVDYYRIKPDVKTFEMLFKSLTKNGYSKNFPIIFEYLQDLKASLYLGNRTNYWIIRAQSMIKFNVSKDKLVTAQDIQRARSLVGNLNWGAFPDGFTTKTWSRSEPNIRKVLRFLSCIPKPLKMVNKEKIVGVQKSEKKRKFRERIRFIALQNAMSKRIPYANDWYGSLKKELQERNVIEKVNDETKQYIPVNNKEV